MTTVRFVNRHKLNSMKPKLSFASCLLVLGGFWLAACHPGTEAPPPPMNVLFIAVDDLRPELGVYGSRALTPNIDRLAESGLQLNRAYCNQAVCGASRLSLMTGLYPEYTDERSFHVREWRQRHPEVVTLNQLFKQNGYTTVGLGKIYHAWSGPDTDLENWTEWIPPQGSKYADPETVELGKQQAKAFGKEFVRGPTTEAGKAPDAADKYFDGWRAAEGVRQIEKLAAADTPFFLAVGFSKPHLPFTAPVKFWDLYERESFSMPDNPGIPPGYPEYAANQRPGEMRHYSDVPPPSDGKIDQPNPKEFPEAMNKRLIHGYHAAVSYTDRNIGKLMEALEKSGKAGEHHHCPLGGSRMETGRPFLLVQTHQFRVRYPGAAPDRSPENEVGSRNDRCPGGINRSLSDPGRTLWFGSARPFAGSVAGSAPPRSSHRASRLCLFLLSPATG
jgi:hypothetical protein